MVEQAVHFDSLAANMQVKLPVTAAGVAAIEEVTYRGVNINATVCFSVPQAIAVAEAVERGLRRCEAQGIIVDKMSPVCTIMVGSLPPPPALDRIDRRRHRPDHSLRLAKEVQRQ
ncbi:MAG: transaldolase family protein [Bellilinea sp.]